MEKECIVCKKKYYKRVNCSLKEWGKSKYCSHECRIKGSIGRPAWNKGLSINLNPNGSFKKGFKWSEEVKEKMRGRIPWNKGMKGIHLSPDTEFKKGNVPWHKGKGLTSSDRLLRQHKIYKEWRSAVLERDNFTCVLCGYKSCTRINGRSDIIADHIKPYALFPELRVDLTNGRTLCHSCHKETKTYGLNKQYFKT